VEEQLIAVDVGDADDGWSGGEGAQAVADRDADIECIIGGELGEDGRRFLGRDCIELE
jgi:hypothetical protein